MKRKRFDWETLTDSQLLDVRIRDLGVRIEGTWIEEGLEDLYADLARREIPFRPHAWLSSDWFVPDDVPGIAVPFYLAHPRLMKLERKQMLDVEGGTRQELIKILRHECGHAVDIAYALGNAARRRELFGDRSKRYPDHYRPNPASRRYVHHLRLYYAQSHPAEDFAETFAVVLGSAAAAGASATRTGRRCRSSSMSMSCWKGFADERRGIATGACRNRLPTIGLTLREYYADKRERYLASYPDIYDRDLRRLFSDDPRHRASRAGARASCAATARRSASWCRTGRASISSRSSRCSRT